MAKLPLRFAVFIFYWSRDRQDSDHETVTLEPSSEKLVSDEGHITSASYLQGFTAYRCPSALREAS
jgi:hypothetical protein